jgi:hypothetical protein
MLYKNCIITPCDIYQLVRNITIFSGLLPWLLRGTPQFLPPIASCNDIAASTNRRVIDPFTALITIVIALQVFQFVSKT